MSLNRKLGKLCLRTCWREIVKNYTNCDSFFSLLTTMRQENATHFLETRKGDTFFCRAGLKEFFRSELPYRMTSSGTQQNAEFGDKYNTTLREMAKQNTLDSGFQKLMARAALQTVRTKNFVEKPSHERCKVKRLGSLVLHP